MGTIRCNLLLSLQFAVISCAPETQRIVQEAVCEPEDNNTLQI